jgi:hypothetical protein
LKWRGTAMGENIESARTDNLRAYQNVHFIEANYENTLNQINENE